MRRKINFKGRVQGVGFRWNSKDALKNYNVKGYVKNLPDGTVELLQGKEMRMSQLPWRRLRKECEDTGRVGVRRTYPESLIGRILQSNTRECSVYTQ